jgi:hypothetical protein
MENWRRFAHGSKIYKDSCQSLVCIIFLSKCHIYRKVGSHYSFLYWICGQKCMTGDLGPFSLLCTPLHYAPPHTTSKWQVTASEERLGTTVLEVKPVARHIRNNVHFHCGCQGSGVGVIGGRTEPVLYLSPHKLESRTSAGACVISGREAPCPAPRSTYHGWQWDWPPAPH